MGKFVNPGAQERNQEKAVLNHQYRIEIQAELIKRVLPGARALPRLVDLICSDASKAFSNGYLESKHFREREDWIRSHSPRYSFTRSIRRNWPEIKCYLEDEETIWVAQDTQQLEDGKIVRGVRKARRNEIPIIRRVRQKALLTSVDRDNERVETANMAGFELPTLQVKLLAGRFE